jgi:hypothetical protein
MANNELIGVDVFRTYALSERKNARKRLPASTETLRCVQNEGISFHTKSGFDTPFFSKLHILVETFRRNVSTTKNKKGVVRADLVSVRKFWY